MGFSAHAPMILWGGGKYPHSWTDSIAELQIVHGVVDEFHGAANKNNGTRLISLQTQPRLLRRT